MQLLSVPAVSTRRHHTAKMVSRSIRRLLLLASCSLLAAEALVLESGQRIAPLRSTSPTTDSPASTRGKKVVTTTGLLDLPAVESWATSENLSERHLKTLYRVLLRSAQPSNEENGNRGDDQLFHRLIENDFPHAAASSLLLHNNQYKFVESTSRVVSVSPSQRGYKLAVQYDGDGGNGDGPIVETVLIRHAVDASSSNKSSRPERYTVCVSCQHGCARACTFCETGTMGLRGNLSSGQILEQVRHAELYLQQQHHDGHGAAGKVRNIVFMGMGEATDTYEYVHEACRGLTHQCLFGLAAKQITISTVGAAPDKIKDFALDMPGVSLALSLHGATQELREELIPSARGVRGSTLDDLAEALDYHSEQTGRGVMIEYLLIQNVNDGE